jgi:type IX secretion system PorP/SprF family membrane protein
MKIKLYISIALICYCLGLLSQQMPSVSQFDKNLIHLNPAATGNQEALTIGFTYRKQWAGFSGAPSNQVFSAHAPLRNPKVAIGLLLENENSGSTNYTGIYLNYAYRVRVAGGKLSFGLKGGINAGSQSVTLRDPNDQAFNKNNNSFVIPNFGFGVLYSKNTYWAGFSIPRLFGFESKSSGSYILSSSTSRYEYFFAGGGKIYLNSDIDFEPSALVVLSGAFKTRITVNALGVYRNVYKVGVGYRSGDAIIFQVGYSFNRQLSLGYSYDLNTGDINQYTSGSHEINMQYRFGYQINASSPRYF